MPIVIQDLLASDTISQAADKINFNFDQLILNGGGAPGPRGLAGPFGPAGGRGIRGSVWYKDTTPLPGTEPNNIIISGLNEDDLYLQTNGQVWSYSGNIWVDTGINLIGRQGEAGSGVGFAYAGGFPGQFDIKNENVAFPIIMPTGSGGGATQGNQGVSTVMIGAVGGEVNPPTATPPIAFDSSFKISNEMAKQLDSSLVSLLIHQKDLTSSAIRFMGGGVEPLHKYEQADLQKLTNITLGVDDSFDINVPKAATNPGPLSDLIGFNLNTNRKGQQFRAGKHINFITGADTSPSGSNDEISDVSFKLFTSNRDKRAKFSVDTIGENGGQTAKFELGGSVILPDDAVDQTGTGLTLANIIHLVGNQIELKKNAANRISVLNTGITIQTGEGALALATSANQPINIGSAATVAITAATNVSTNAATGIALATSGGDVVVTASSGKVNTGAATGINLTTTGGNVVITASSGKISNVGNTEITGELKVSSTTTVDGKLTLNSVEGGNGDLLVIDPATREVKRSANFANASIPIGGIIMWSGVSVPAGFALCDGAIANGSQTPDLRGRFIVGQDPRQYPGGTVWDENYNKINNTGGEKLVTLTTPQLPSHTHALNDNRHLIGDKTRGSSLSNVRTGLAARDVPASNKDGANNVFGNGISNTGNNDPHENRPPYFVLAFIMFVGVQ